MFSSMRRSGQRGGGPPLSKAEHSYARNAAAAAIRVTVLDEA
jgi:hypothetical protein